MSTETKTIFSPALAARFDRMVTLYPRAPFGADSHAALRAGRNRLSLRRSDREVASGSASPNLMFATSSAITPCCAPTRLASIMYRYAPISVACCAAATNCLQHCKKRLGIGHKETTPDKLFSLEEVECIGACSWAPAVQVNYDFHENLTPESMDKVLADYKART